MAGSVPRLYRNSHEPLERFLMWPVLRIIKLPLLRRRLWKSTECSAQQNVKSARRSVPGPASNGLPHWRHSRKAVTPDNFKPSCQSIAPTRVSVLSLRRSPLAGSGIRSIIPTCRLKSPHWHRGLSPTMQHFLVHFLAFGPYKEPLLFLGLSLCTREVHEIAGRA